MIHLLLSTVNADTNECMVLFQLPETDNRMCHVITGKNWREVRTALTSQHPFMEISGSPVNKSILFEG